MVYLYDACDQISDFCHQQLLRKMRRKISWTDGRTEGRTDGRTDGQMDRGKTVYPRPPSGSGGIQSLIYQTSSFTLRCRDNDKMMKGCNYCMMTIPCQCTFIGNNMQFAQKIVLCNNETRDITTL